MDSLQEIFEKMIPSFQTIFGNTLHKIILYGSFAKGTQTEESDVDIAVITREHTEDMLSGRIGSGILGICFIF